MVFTNEKLNKLLIGGYEKAVSEDKDTFIAFYAYLFDDNDPCTTCGSKLQGYWNKLVDEGKEKLRIKNNIIMAKKGQNTQEELANEQVSKLANDKCAFRLREGIGSLAMDFGSSELFNNDTITNEIAVKYLKINKNRIANFEVYPENWEELIK